jgi:hypothetical protein
MACTPRTAIDFPYLHGGMVAEIASGRSRSHACPLVLWFIARLPSKGSLLSAATQRAASSGATPSRLAPFLPVREQVDYSDANAVEATPHP